METRKQLTLGVLFATVVVLLTTAVTNAYQAHRGRELTNAALNLPGIRQDFAKPHSDAWTDAYLDKYAASTFTIRVDKPETELARGGMAGMARSANAVVRTAKALAIVTRGVKPHSAGWDAFYFDRNVNLQLPNLWTIPAPTATLNHATPLGRTLNRFDLLP